MINLVIFGSRGLDDYDLVDHEVNRFIKAIAKEEGMTIRETKKNITIVEGGASGADKLGGLYAIYKGYHLKVMKADWKEYGKRAGHIRNGEMTKICKYAIGFWDGVSPGTKDMIDQCNNLGLVLKVVNYEVNKDV